MPQRYALLFGLILLSSCALNHPGNQRSATPAATPPPTDTRKPTGTPRPTDAPSPTNTPVPTATPIPITASISPNLEQVREEGFHWLVGHPPFTVDFSAEVEGGCGDLSYAWDLDGDGTSDGDSVDLEPFTYTESGEYTVTLRISDGCGQKAQRRQRVVVIGQPDWPDWRYGVTAHLDYVPDLYASEAEVERAAQMIGDLGVDVVRHDLLWTKVQPLSSTYDWDTYDYVAELSQQYGFDLLPIIGYSAAWASSAGVISDWQDWFYAPPSLTKYAWFAYRAVDRYKATVHAWQVWNEPNVSIFWRPEPDPVLYTELLKHTYLAIKYADPGAVVVLGGLANDGSTALPEFTWYPPDEFLQAVYDAGGGPYFDAVARHPYTSPREGPGSLLGKLKQFRAIVEVNGDNEKPIWVTESGFSALPAAAVTDSMQGRWVAQSFDAILSLDYVPVVAWYNFREKGTDPNNWEHNYGLIEKGWAIKPAYEAYRDYIASDPRGTSRR